MYKLKQTIVFEGRHDSSELAKQIYSETGIRFMLEKEGQEVNGFINTYIQIRDGQEFTVVDVFYYDENILIAKEENVLKHNLKTKLNDTNLNKVEKSLLKGKKIADKEVAIEIIKNLGQNIVNNN